jgi:hypothetical protein
MTQLKLPGELSEREEQILLVQWLNLKGLWHAASGNGGFRHIGVAVQMVKMGLSAGYPDLFIPLSCGGKHGLHIEMKPKKGGRLTTEQRMWLQYLNESGYVALVANGFEEGVQIVENYLALHDRKPKKGKDRE